MRFEFATAGRVVFGAGTISELPAAAKSFGAAALVVTGSNPERFKSTLESMGMTLRYLSVAGEPTVDIVREGAQMARYANVVIGIGGGSAIDAAKAIAAVAPNSGEPLDYLEVVGKALPLQKAPLPFIAVPTTAGTGAEVTRNAVLGSPAHGVKASIRSPLMLARVAIVDPDLTRDIPGHITATAGLDALTQLIEPYVSCRANPFIDALCRDGLPRAVRALPVVFKSGSAASAREEMLFASLLSGMALANAGLGAVHGFAAPLGGMLNAPHGALCAAVLPHATAVNIRALRERAPAHQSLGKYAYVAALLTAGQACEAEAAPPALKQLSESMSIPTLKSYGLTAAAIPEVVEKAAAASSMKANPLPLTKQELTEILERSL